MLRAALRPRASMLRRAPTSLRASSTFQEHPLKGTVTTLLHQRPFQRVELPSLVSSLTLMPSRWQASLRGCENHAPVGNALYASAPDQYEADYRHLCELCTFFHVTPPAHGSTFFSTDLGGACRLRWERHTEAQTYTFTKAANEADRERPFGEASVAISLIPKAWLASLPGLVLSAVHVAMLPSSSQTARYELASIGQHFHLDEEALVRAATVDRGRFRVYSDWRTHSDGFGRVIVHGMPLDETPNKRTAAGKVLQRVVEVCAGAASHARIAHDLASPPATTAPPSVRRLLPPVPSSRAAGQVPRARAARAALRAEAHAPHRRAIGRVAHCHRRDAQLGRRGGRRSGGGRGGGRGDGRGGGRGGAAAAATAVDRGGARRAAGAA
jgi:hypothetical protein